MPSDSDNITPSSVQGKPEIPIASPFRYTSVPKDISRQGNADKSCIANSRREASWRKPWRSDIECLLRWLDPRLTKEDFPIAIQFITHGIRTTVIFERCAAARFASHEPEKQN